MRLASLLDGAPAARAGAAAETTTERTAATTTPMSRAIRICGRSVASIGMVDCTIAGHAHPRRRNPLAQAARPRSRTGDGSDIAGRAAADAAEAALDPDEDADGRRLLRPQEAG